MGRDQQRAPSPLIERAIEEAIAARKEGRAAEAVDRVATASTWIGKGPVRRELRVALPRERGLACIVLGQPDKAREGLMLALEQADGEPALADPIRATLASLELMVDDPRRADAWLADRGRDRRATLLALARMQLYLGATPLAEEALQACEQAPGGTSGLNPPTSALRCLVHVWSKRPEQARLLYDGVATNDNPHWEMVKLLTLRSLWVQSGDARYLQLALGTAEQLRFGHARAPLPGLTAAAAAHHAVLLALTGDISLAVDAADSALAQLGRLTLPEWPRQAILHDLAVVYREAGQLVALAHVVESYNALPTGAWAERMQLVTGARAVNATTVASTTQRSDVISSGGGVMTDVALRMMEDPRAPRGVILTALCEHIGAHGARWLNGRGAAEAKVGTAIVASDEPEPPYVFRLDGDHRIEFYGANPKALSQIDVTVLERLAWAAQSFDHDRFVTESLQDAVRLADAGRRAAEESLERTRRHGSSVVLGGSFSSVDGRSEPLRTVLDRLATLSGLTLPVLLEGKSGSGRRHLAQAYHALNATEGAACPTLDMALVPQPAQIATLTRLIEQARGGCFIVANAEHLAPAACSWLIQELGEPRGVVGRAVFTLDIDAKGPVVESLQGGLAPGRVAVPGLDERLEDLPLLIDAFARAAGRRPEDVSTAARAVLARRSWPGHLAELRTTIGQAAVRSGKAAILPEHLQANEDEASASLSESIGLGYHDAVRTFRRNLLRHALGVTAGNRTRAAELLGLQRTYFMRLIRDLGASDTAPRVGANGLSPSCAS